MAKADIEEIRESDRRININAILISLLIMAVIIGIVWTQKEKYDPVLVSTVAPDFNVKRMDGVEVQLSDYRGKVVFLNFWATWCKPCREEMPSMEVLYNNFKDKEFVILAVSIDKWPSAITSFAEELRLTFPLFHDQWGKVDRRYKLTGVPETYIIDQNGMLAEKIIGPRDWTRRDNLKTIFDLLENGPKSSYK